MAHRRGSAPQGSHGVSEASPTQHFWLQHPLVPQSLLAGPFPPGKLFFSLSALREPSTTSLLSLWPCRIIPAGRAGQGRTHPPVCRWGGAGAVTWWLQHRWCFCSRGTAEGSQRLPSDLLVTPGYCPPCRDSSGRDRISHPRDGILLHKQRDCSAPEPPAQCPCLQSQPLIISSNYCSVWGGFI